MSLRGLGNLSVVLILMEKLVYQCFKNFAMIILLNIEAFKIKGIIGKLVIWSDIVLILALALHPVSRILNFSAESPYWDFFDSFYTGLIVVVLVNLYRDKKEKACQPFDWHALCYPQPVCVLISIRT